MLSSKAKVRIKSTREGTSQHKLLQHLNDYDWATGQYRAGRNINDIADDIGVARSQLFDYFSKNNISRDLSSEIRNKTNALLAGDQVDMTNAIMPTSEEEIIAINATMQACLIREHRADIRRMRKLAMAMLYELEIETTDRDLFEDLGTVLRREDEAGRDGLNDLYKKIISTPGRVDSLKKLSDVLKTVIMLERQAFGMRDDFEDSEIRKGKIASSQAQLPLSVADDYQSITMRFMKVLNGVEDAVIIGGKEAPQPQSAEPGSGEPVQAAAAP
jgi:hypothetical protein